MDLDSELSESDRWLLINGLRTAAEVYDVCRMKMVAENLPTMARQFEIQACDAIAMAVQLERAAQIILIQPGK